MRLKIIIGLFCLLAIQPLYSIAKEREKVDLAVVANSNTLLQYQENGENKGSSVEILNTILKEAKLKADIIFMPWARAFSTAKHNSNTLILSMIRTPEREPYFHWIIKVSDAARVFISLKSKPENYVDTIDQAKQKVTGVILDSSSHKELKALGFSEKKNLYVVSSEEQITRLFANGRIDLVYSDPNNLKNNLHHINTENIAISYKKISLKDQRDSYIALNINSDKKLLNQLQLAAEKFTKTPEYLYLLTK
jgi:ABC-type amino acid transport substrate-binding protein